MSAFYLTFLVLFSSTPEGLMQMTLLKQFDDVESCKHAVQMMPLSDEQKDQLGCVRVLKGNAKFVEA